MDINEEKLVTKQRDKTDKSLVEERIKTDEYLNNETKSLEQASDDAIQLSRIAADKKLAHERLKNNINGNLQSPKVEKKVMIERASADESQKNARAEEDRLHQAERSQQRLNAESRFESERMDTDINLHNERDRNDLASQLDSTLLQDEKFSHNLTKTALVTRDQYLAIVSHDLKNPLGAITLSLAMAKRAIMKGEVDSNNILKSLEIAERSAAHMDRMISDLLDVERMDSGKLILNLERCNIYDLLCECKNLFAPIALEKKISLTVEPCDRELYADIDHDRILQVLSNLIGNAQKFANDGAEVILSAKKKGNGIEVSVIDNGPGIAKEKLSQIFEKFSQLQFNDRRGLGLGLFISKWIVEAHHGRIYVTSEEGKGTAFYFSLPLRH